MSNLQFTALASLGLLDKALGEYEEANRILPKNEGIIKDMNLVRDLLKNEDLQSYSSSDEEQHEQIIRVDLK